MPQAMPQPGKLRTFPTAVAARLLRLPQAHAALLADDPVSAVLLERLHERGLLMEAARLIGYALPEREAVWWACKCVAYTAPASLPPEQEAALAAAENWVRRPDDATRANSARAAAGAGYDTACAWTARAAFASRPAYELHPRCGRRIERAIALAAVSGGAARAEPSAGAEPGAQAGPRGRPEPGARIETRLQRFLASGLDIARGGGGHLPPHAG
jgi:hypothetical protein